MWLEFNWSTKKINYAGFCSEKLSDKYIFTNPLYSNNAEQFQRIEYMLSNNSLKFSRDYLGFCPLFYSCSNNKIFLSDDYSEIVAWLKKESVKITISEFALALYFVMGYVPQGHTLFEQIQSCENTSTYVFAEGNVKRKDLFQPIEHDPTFKLSDLKEAILGQTEKYTNGYEQVDVWCSGGLDSSIIAYSASQCNVDPSLLTFNYPDSIQGVYGRGEVPYVKYVSNVYNMPLKINCLSKEQYAESYSDFIKSFPMPVIDICVPPKYFLAKHTNKLALTGEGGDPIFSGVKNNFVLYMMDRYRQMDLGWVYALSHLRFAIDLKDIFKTSDEQKYSITNYFNGLFDGLGCSLVKKLFYLNTLLKQGSLIFPENYYAAKTYNVNIKHPLTSLDVYNLAFKLSDEERYQYPNGKLALIEMFKTNVPNKIISRKKSGTLIPLASYIDDKKILLPEILTDCGFLNVKQIISKMNESVEEVNYLFRYALKCLVDWINVQLEVKSDGYLSPDSRSVNVERIS